MKLRVTQIVLLVSIATTPALAQNGAPSAAPSAAPGAAPSAAPGEPTEAQLFEEGRAAYARGEFTLACQRFGQSTTLKPSVGGYLNLANCLERIEHVREAAQAWQSAVSAAQGASDARGEYAQQRLSALIPRIPTIAFKRAAALPEGSGVTLDTQPVAVFGRPLQLDPGEHAIVVRAPAAADRAFRIFLVMDEHREIVAEPGVSTAPPPSALPAMPPLAAPPPSSVPPPGARAATPGGDSEPPQAKLSAGTWLLIGSGVGWGLSLLSGALVLDAKAGVHRDCDAQGTCNPEGIHAAERGRLWSQVGTWSFVAGAALLGTGLTLELIGDKPRSSRASGWVVGYEGRF